MRGILSAVVMGLLILSLSVTSLAVPAGWERDVYTLPSSHVIPRLPSETGKNLPEPKIVGKWGCGGENQSAGWFIATFKRTKRKFFVVKGLLNTTDNSIRARFFGIVKKCYFNGIIRLENKTIPVIGLLKINRDKHILLMRWMTPRSSGWAKGKIIQRSTIVDI